MTSCTLQVAVRSRMSSAAKSRTYIERGVFVLDAWVVPFEQAKAGKVSFVDPSGRRRAVNVGSNNDKSKEVMKPIFSENGKTKDFIWPVR